MLLFERLPRNRTHIHHPARFRATYRHAPSVFPPDSCHLCARPGRAPKNWTDLKDAGTTKSISPAPKGFKYVYDPIFGLETVKDTENAQ
tara:strand:+ start:468 stop:734 length:267 start_codon:yes stop_codon:yes gene_type:complete